MTKESWVIRDKATKVVVMETFSEETVNKLNTNKYEAITILEYLYPLNEKGLLS